MILDILIFPDPRLRTRALPVDCVDNNIKRLVDNMLETMYYSEGIGLAATQVNVHKRIIVMDISPEQDQPLVFINPEVSVCGEGEREFEEGCLSVPGYAGTVSRPDDVMVRALDRHGEPFELHATGLLAVCIQHEIDHLEGVVFVDYLSDLKRERIRQALRGQQISPKEIGQIHRKRRAQYNRQSI